mgnify:CR=1 FL=1
MGPDERGNAQFLGPDLYNQVFTALQGKANRAVLRTYVDYKVTDNWKVFLDASYVKVTGYGIFSPAFSSGVVIVTRLSKCSLRGSSDCSHAATRCSDVSGDEPTPARTRGPGRGRGRAPAGVLHDLRDAASAELHDHHAHRGAAAGDDAANTTFSHD